MKKLQNGFTLIELMIVVAIIGILAAVAIPAYQDYIVKSKLSKVQTTLDPIKLGLALYYQENGSFPNTTSTVTPAGGAADAFWTSVGLTTLPVLPNEVSSLVANGTGLTSVTLTLTLDKIKAGTGACSPTTAIDGCILTIVGTPGSTAITWPAAASGVYSTNTIVRKYFNY